MNVSTLSAVFAIALLSSPSLPSLVALNSRRLADAYKLLTNFLKSHGIRYFPCNAGLFVLARLAPNAQSWDDEAAAIDKLQEAGVLVGAGRRYHVHEMGWARISFAVKMTVLEEAMRRLETVL
jgi:aspartate/methionine/tyrosine aminotransferase